MISLLIIWTMVAFQPVIINLCYSIPISDTDKTVTLIKHQILFYPCHCCRNNSLGPFSSDQCSTSCSSHLQYALQGLRAAQQRIKSDQAPLLRYIALYSPKEKGRGWEVAGDIPLLTPLLNNLYLACHALRKLLTPPQWHWSTWVGSRIFQTRTWSYLLDYRLSVERQLHALYRPV